MKSLAQILQSAGEIVGKIESSDTMASTKSIVRGLTQNFNQGYQNSKAPKQLDLFSEDYESFQARMRALSEKWDKPITTREADND